MTKPQSTLEAVVWVAIDVAKDRHEVLIEAPGWKSRKKFRVQNTAEEFRAFAEFLHGLSLPAVESRQRGQVQRILARWQESAGPARCNSSFRKLNERGAPVLIDGLGHDLGFSLLN